MTIEIIAENRAAKFPNAVVFCCDEKYLPFAALAIHTLLRNNPLRDYDICIASLDALTMPPALAGHDIRLCRIDAGDAFAGMPVSKHFSIAAYLRIALPEAFANAYDRILYLDSDVFVVGEALADIFLLDLKGRPVGACTDCGKLKRPNKPSDDQKALGLNGPYFNSGMLLIDVNVFREQRVMAKCVDVLTQYGAERIFFDQTLLNVALIGNWTELHPAWNWQWAIVRPLFEMAIDIQVVHFVAAAKPWNDPKGLLPIKYRQTARRFLDVYYPSLVEQIGSPSTRLSKRAMIFRLWKHILKSFRFVDGYNRHGGDIMKVVLPK